MSELELFEKYAADTYESIARYEALPTKPYKSLEVEAAHDAWMARANLGEWTKFDEGFPVGQVFHAWHRLRKESHIIDLRHARGMKDEYSHWMEIQEPTNPPIED